MTRIVEKKVRSRVHANPFDSISTKAENATVAAENALVEDRQTFLKPPVGVLPFLNTNWQKNAVERFLADYTTTSDVVPGNLQFLPNLCASPNLCCYLKEALHAAAFKSLGNQLGFEWMGNEGDLAYGRALPLLAEALACEATEDSTLAATLLFGMYEVSLI